MAALCLQRWELPWRRLTPHLESDKKYFAIGKVSPIPPPAARFTSPVEYELTELGGSLSIPLAERASAAGGFPDLAVNGTDL